MHTVPTWPSLICAALGLGLAEGLEELAYGRQAAQYPLCTQ